jgi:UDP-N-acetyl-D-mannosaminuronic acid dehydrogenase
MSIVVLGGAGHVGLPLSIMLAERGHEVVVFDIAEDSVKTVSDGRMPFWEPEAEPILKRNLEAGNLRATTDPSCIQQADTLVVVVGTPVDSHLNPNPDSITRALQDCRPFLKSGQMVILRSTIFPGVTSQVEALLSGWDLDIDVVFAPERIAEHHAMRELVSLPQIISARTDSAFDRASALFLTLTTEVVRLTPEEAELAKLFTNAWRYIKFAAANQFFMLADSKGLDFESIRRAITHNYPRAADLPGAGFAAGPCLLKDTMQLAAFSNNQFMLGNSAMLVNEGLPLYLVSKLESNFDLRNSVVGILGMAFKGGSDDIRSSLSYKLKRVLEFKAKAVITTDPKVSLRDDPNIIPLDDVLQRADIIIVAAPHEEYQRVTSAKPVVDIWGVTSASSSGRS